MKSKNVKDIKLRNSIIKASGEQLERIVTIPENLPKKHLIKFFEKSYEFMSERYGEKNVISSHVHLTDTAHMHFNFSSVTKDKIIDDKSITKENSQNFNKDLLNYLDKHFNDTNSLIDDKFKIFTKEELVELEAKEAQKPSIIEQLKNNKEKAAQQKPSSEKDKTKKLDIQL